MNAGTCTARPTSREYERGAGNVRRFPDQIAPEAREKVGEIDGTDTAKEHSGHAWQWDRIENAARNRDTSANRLVVELVIKALEHQEWPRTETEIRVARASLFAAQVLARDLISSGREQEIDEIRDFISTIAPDGHTGKPVRGRSDDRPTAAELIRGRMLTAAGNASGVEASAIPVGLAPLIERTFRYAYLLATLKRDEMVDEVGSGPRVGMNIASDNGRNDSARHRDTGVGRGHSRMTTLTDDLSMVARSGTASDVRATVSAGADPGTRDEMGGTPLHWAAEMNPVPSVIVALIEAGADSDARADDGLTPLHGAATMNNAPSVVAALIEAGADPGARDDGGKTPFDYAKDNAALRGIAIYWRLNEGRFE